MRLDANAIDRTAERAGRGLVVPLITPLTDDSEIVDLMALQALIQFLICCGVHGLITCGTTGEGALLSHEERQRITEVTVQAAAGGVPVLAQTGAATTAETITLTRHAQACGADAATVVTPYYGRDLSLFKAGLNPTAADCVPGRGRR